MESERTVTISLPTDSVERRASRDGHEFFVGRLPEGMQLDGLDLSGWQLCSSFAHDDRERAGFTQFVVPGDAPKRVRRPSPASAGDASFAEVDPTRLGEAVGQALEGKRRQAVTSQVAQLMEAGDLEAAYETLGALLHGDVEVLPPGQPARAEVDKSTPSTHNMTRGYEAVGILPAFHPACSVNTRSPTATVPKRFTHVAFDAEHCVTREYFEELLERVRSRPPRYAGALSEHGIGYVAHQLAHPFKRRDRHPVAELNGIGVSFSHEVTAVPGARVRQAAAASPERDVIDLGCVSVYVDRALAIEQDGLSAGEASIVAERVISCVESEYALMMDRVGAAHVSSLLRSPDATKVLLESGATIENPTTGEHLRRDPSTGRLSGDMRGVTAQPDDPAFYECCLLHVATDDCWRVMPEDAVRIANGSDSASRRVREAAESAYLADESMYPRQRLNNLPTREQTETLLSVRDEPHFAPRMYAPVGDRLGARNARAMPTGAKQAATERVA